MSFRVSVEVFTRVLLTVHVKKNFSFSLFVPFLLGRSQQEDKKTEARVGFLHVPPG